MHQSDYTENMHFKLRLVLLLVLAITLRGFAGAAYALPSIPVDFPVMADCHEPVAPTHVHHAGDEKACQIACDLAVSPALPVDVSSFGGVQPSVLTPTLTVLAINDPPAPDHPPPIR